VRILSVARQYPRKNTGALVRAFARLRRSVPGARLRVVGGGPRLPALRELAADLGLGGAATFLGEVEDADRVRAEYRRADLFCLPSLQEGFGIVFLEAMAAGLPIVAGRTAAVPEVVPHGEVGLLVSPRDEAALAVALERLAREPETRRAMGRAGRERVRRFTWEEVARTFLEETGLVPRRRSAELGA
jgi:glycosyltransferase involved in cell wall biosynthesis